MPMPDKPTARCHSASDLFRHFLAEDFSRSELLGHEQEREFQKWKATKE